MSYPHKLDERNVHVWSVRIDAQDPVAAAFELLLRPDEIDRAARYKFDYLRRSFALARGALRILLGRYLGLSPASIEFKYGSKGKPALATAASVDFNASH